MISSVRRSDMSRQLKVNGICSWPRAPMRSPVVRRSSSEKVGEPSASSPSASAIETARWSAVSNGLANATVADAICPSGAVTSVGAI